MTGSDPSIAEGIAAGEPAAFEAAYDRHGESLYRHLLARTGRADLAEDLLSAVMLRLVRYRRRLRGVANLRAYLFTLARNELARHFGRRRPEATEQELDGLAVPTDDPERETLENLREALSRLDADRREVVNLKVYDRLTFAEIGAALAISPNTAASRYRYALADLRKMLEDEDGTRTGR